MGWKTVWLGSETPTSGQVAKTAISLAFMALALHGGFVRFVPHELLTGRSGTVMFGAVGTAGAIALGWYSARLGTSDVFFRKGILKFLLIFFGMPVFLGVLFWLVFAKSLPWMFTSAFGSEFRLDTVMRTEHSYSRRSCDYRLEGSILEGNLPDHLCLKQELYDRYPDQSLPVVLVGKQTILGTSVRTAYLREQQ